MPIAKCAELSVSSSHAMTAPPPPAAGTLQRADEIDYKIFGSDMQFVEIELDPGESAVAEAGSLMYKQPVVRMDTVFGDGSQQSASGGFMDKLLGAGKRIITGESLFTTVFTHSGSSGKAKAAFAAPYPGTIIPFTLTNYGGKIICQKDSFLCAARGVSIGIFFQKKVMTALFGGEGFIMQKLEGDGLVFVHAGGTGRRTPRSRYRLRGRDDQQRAIRRDPGRRREVDAVRRRRRLPRPDDRPRPRLAAVPALLAHGRPHVRRCLPARRLQGRRLRPRRTRRHPFG
jgi:uncharacterized protein (AIM24 family)